MESKFSQLPVDEDTAILFQQEAKLGEFDVLYQKWFWDGIIAESIIFVDEDVAEFKDEDVEKIVRASPLVETESKITLERSASGFTFVNFNFKTE